MVFPDMMRYDDNMWAYRQSTDQQMTEEVRVITPAMENKAIAYQLAGSVMQFLLHPPLAADYYKLEISGPSGVKGFWLLENITEDWHMEQQKGGFTIYRYLPNEIDLTHQPKQAIKHQKIWRILPIPLTGFPTQWWQDWSHFANTCYHFLDKPISIEALYPPELPTYKVGSSIDPVSSLEKGCFNDPFTLLASTAFQQSESPFVSEKKLQSRLTFSLKEGVLSLTEKPVAQQEAKAAKDLFLNYVKAVYGKGTLRAIEQNLDISYEHLNTLSSDAVFRFNVGSQFTLNLRNLIQFHKQISNAHTLDPLTDWKEFSEQFPVQDRLRETKDFSSLAPLVSTLLPLTSWNEFYQQFPLKKRFVLREIRGFYRYALKKFANENAVLLKDLFAPFQGKSLADLSLQACDDLVCILVDGFDLTPGATNREMFTGRRIEHLPICGYKTMGDGTEFDPTRNWFELLHIYPNLSKGEWHQQEMSFYELLVQVLVKKSPLDFDDTRTQRMAGRLFPGPTVDGTRTWYHIHSFSNDYAGDLNYFLKPVSTYITDEKELPAIKLFRSTASDSEAESSFDSIRADLNPQGVGSLNTLNNDEYEKEDLYSCTIPLWMGYLVQGNLLSALEAFDTYVLAPQPTVKNPGLPANEQVIVDCLNWLRKSDDGVHLWEQFVALLGPQKLQFLMQSSVDRKEWTGAIKKQKQDILFMGHSLGGALTQQSLVHFISLGRIPLPSCNYICYCFDSPGTTFLSSEVFMAFGEKHASLLKDLNQTWGIRFQFEKEDLVPQGGDIFLGTDLISALSPTWFSFEAHIYRPLFDTVKSLEISGMPTHGRRFHLAEEGVGHDFISEKLTAEELRTLKTGWRYQASPIMDKFGYKFLPPWLSEKIRTSIGTVTFPFMNKIAECEDDQKLGNALRISELEN